MRDRIDTGKKLLTSGEVACVQSEDKIDRSLDEGSTYAGDSCDRCGTVKVINKGGCNAR